MGKATASVAVLYSSDYGYSDRLSQTLARGITKAGAATEMVDVLSVDPQVRYPVLLPLSELAGLALDLVPEPTQVLRPNVPCDSLHAWAGVSPSKEKKRKEKKRKDYAWQRQFNEKPSIIPGCPVPKMSLICDPCFRASKQITKLGSC